MDRHSDAELVAAKVDELFAVLEEGAAAPFVASATRQNARAEALAEENSRLAEALEFMRGRARADALEHIGLFEKVRNLQKENERLRAREAVWEQNLAAAYADRDAAHGRAEHFRRDREALASLLALPAEEVRGLRADLDKPQIELIVEAKGALQRLREENEWLRVTAKRALESLRAEQNGVCGAPSGSLRFRCTREVGHSGNHEEINPETGAVVGWSS